MQTLLFVCLFCLFVLFVCLFTCFVCLFVCCLCLFYFKFSHILRDQSLTKFSFFSLSFFSPPPIAADERSFAHFRIGKDGRAMGELLHDCIFDKHLKTNKSKLTQLNKHSHFHQLKIRTFNLGLIFTADEVYYVDPASHHFTEAQSFNHVVYRESDHVVG